MSNQTHKTEHGHTIIFNESGHKYVKDNQYVPGTSGILDMLANNSLWGWKLSEQEKAIKKAMEVKNIPIDVIADVMIEAKSGNDKKQTKTLSIGTVVHKLAEHWLKKEQFVEPEDKVIKDCFNKFKDFWNKNNLELIESEKILYSIKGFCGTLDIVAKDKKNNLILIDIKTSNGIYHNYVLQLHGYKYAYEEQTGKKINKLCIVRLPKNDDDFESRVLAYKPQHTKAFLGLLDCYKSKQLYDDQLKEYNAKRKNANGISKPKTKK
jgi:hypothetical protein